MKQRTESRYVLRQVQKDRFEGTIAEARKAEDAIIASGMFTPVGGYPDERHPAEGCEATGSRAFSKVYEVYTHPGPKPATREAFLGMEFVIVRFFFDYRSDRATIKVRTEGVRRLRQVIPGFGEALGNGTRQDAVGTETGRELEPGTAIRGV